MTAIENTPNSAVTGAAVDPALLDDIIAFVKRFVIFQDPAHYNILGLWILHTYTFDAAYATPYLYVKSAEKQSGKTRTIEVAALLAHNPVTSAQSTVSSLFRLIESQRPTIFLDEVDAVWTGASNEELRGLLNSGYKKNGTILRTVPGQDGGEVKPFSTFAPKLLAGIDNGQLPDTIADRCITFNLKRKKKDEEVERLNERKIRDDVDALKDRMQRWAAANIDAVMDFEPKTIDEISDRAFEIAEPLLQIASRFKGWTAIARKDLIHLLRAKTAKLSINAEALLIARTLMDGDGNSPTRDRITSAELATALDISAKRLGIILAPYDITPRTIRLPGGMTAKGYHRKDFADAWDRYL